MTEYIFRKQKITDFFALLHLSYVALSHSHSFYLFIFFFLVVPINLILSLLLHKYIVCEHIPTKKVVGYISLSRVPFTKKAIIVYFAVKKEHRRKHIGKNLVEKAIKKLKERGFVDVMIAIKYQNLPMKNLLEASGFKIKKGRVVYELA